MTMPTVRHPRALDDVAGHPAAAVTVRGENYTVADGQVTLPDERHVRALADAHGVDKRRLMQTDSREEMIARGVCPWCDDYDGDHVGQHASSAHPDEWAAYTEEDE